MSTRFAAILTLLFLLGACGQKGDLYLRDEAPDAPVTEEAAPDDDQEDDEE